MQSGKLLLSYWNVRGRAEPIRLLLEYLGVPYAQKFYDLAKYQEWFEQDKKQLDSLFQNLPYVQDGDFVLTESEAICHYLCKKAGRVDLVGDSIDDRITIAQMKGVVDDIRLHTGTLAYNKDFETVKAATLASKITPKLVGLDKYFETNDFLNKTQLCYYDFYLYEILQVLLRMEPSLFSGLDRLNAYERRIANLEQVQAYLSSDRFDGTMKFFGPAFWRG